MPNILKTRRWPQPVINNRGSNVRYHLWDAETEATWCSDERWSFLDDDSHGGAEHWRIIPVSTAQLQRHASQTSSNPLSFFTCSGCKRRWLAYHQAVALIEARQKRSRRPQHMEPIP